MNGPAAVSDWFVKTTSRVLGERLSRRSFIAKATIAGTAVAATGCAGYVQGIVYQSDCPGGSLCRDGFTDFCCMINNGYNACPPNSVASGWWRADNSAFCGGGTRYFIDCNDFSGGGPCHCSVDCNTRKVYCNNFRYGQCNTQFGGTGVIACRVVTCTPPYTIPEMNCNASDAADQSTANHDAPCPTPYVPPPPPPPSVEVSLGAPLAFGASSAYVFVRGPDASIDYVTWPDVANPPTTPQPFTSLSGLLSSKVVAVADTPTTITIAALATDTAFWTNRFDGSTWLGWESRGGSLISDPAMIVDPTNGFVHLFGRGSNRAYYVNTYDPGASTWSGFQFLDGILTSDPAAVVDSSGNIYVFGRAGASNNFYFTMRAAGGTTWSTWKSLDGIMTSDPAAVVDPSGNVYLFGRAGYGNNFWFTKTTDQGQHWSTWTSVDGIMSSDPAAVVDSSGNVYLFGRAGSGNSFWITKTTNGGSSWTTWANLDGVLTSDPAVLMDQTGAIYLFGRGGSANNLYYIRSTDGGATWSPWTSLGGSIVSARGATAP
jgi:hypothetical protein